MLPWYLQPRAVEGHNWGDTAWAVTLLQPVPPWDDPLVPKLGANNALRVQLSFPPCRFPLSRKQMLITQHN